MRRFAPLWLPLLLACGDDPVAPVDAEVPADATSAADTGAVEDAAVPTDAGLSEPDLGADAGSPADLGADPTDLGSPDAEGLDAAIGPDAEPGDAEPSDAGAALEDFATPGPYTVENLSFTSGVPVSCRAPVGRTNGPAVLLNHGFQIAASNYLGWAAHLASWGFVACSVDYEAGFVANHAASAAQIQAVFDAVVAGSVSALAGRVDPARVALLGHSLGGKLSFLVASDRPAVAAVVGFDPVDAAPSLCSSQNCPSAIDRLPIDRPTLILGETTDEARTSALAPACNPAAENFDDFYDASGAGTQEVVIAGASHMSFVDDLMACGFVCAACQDETVARSSLVEIIRWFTTAFLLQSLDGRTDLAPALTGATAQSRFVQPNRVSLRSK